MDLQLVGCNHRTCPLELREQLALAGPAVPRFLAKFRRRFPQSEIVVLSTCNRLELYTGAGSKRHGPSPEEALAFLAEYQGTHPREFDDTFYRYQHERAIHHLFRVASSLDSMILGEPQILRQVKWAYETARRQTCTGPATHGAFQAAIRAARRVARETELFRHRVSIPRLAVRECARHVLGALRDKRIAVIGAGEMAAETLRALRDEGAHQITVLNHHARKARKLAESFQAEVWAWRTLPSVFDWADLVVSATSSPTPLVSLNDFHAWSSVRRQRPLMILDLGVPRDIDHRVALQPGVSLFSIDDLRELAERNRGRRESEIPRALACVNEEVAHFAQCRNARSRSSLIREWQALKSQAQEEELRRLFDQLPNLDDQTRNAVRLALHRFAGKILHPIMTSVRQGNRPVELQRPRRSIKSAQSHG